MGEAAGFVTYKNGRRNILCHNHQSFIRVGLFSFLIASGVGFLGWAADDSTELTLSQFRAQAKNPRPPAPMRGSRSREDPAAEAEFRQRADALFFNLLSAQGKEAAARQSLDRISGWSKAAEARLAAQQLAPLDMELLHFAEAKAASRLAQSEGERRQMLQEANRLLGREPSSSFVVLPNKTASDPPEEPQKSKTPAPASATTSSSETEPSRNASSDLTKLQSRMGKELLPQAHELLGKMYQSYLFGGVALSDLLWVEEEVYDAELQYQLLVVETEKEVASAEPSSL
ncbi:MAG: hypothetical protein HY313_03005 [Acidobacteria bacterium]|nr:hypothetical protein [Acidobacteriota bacterium]